MSGERGGAANQSGVFYQNSVAALYLGQLCNATSGPASDEIDSVRVEALDHVDDIVVSFIDDHVAYIQAKESLSTGGSAWQGLWRDFDKQFSDTVFKSGRDRLLLWTGTGHSDIHDLAKLCQRAATSKNHDEWQRRLSLTQKALVDKIKQQLSPELLQDEHFLYFLSHIEVQIWPQENIEKDLAPTKMPKSNRPAQVMFRLLRDRVGGKARVRDYFTAETLRNGLKAEDPDLEFQTPPDLDSLRKTVKSSGALLRQHRHTIANTGYHVKRAVVHDIANWIQEGSDDTKNVALLIDQAGMGKTVVLHDVLCKLENEGMDILAIKADLQLNGVKSMEEIAERLDLPHSVEQTLARLAKLGHIAVLIDQVDALSLSLAHDQGALNGVLELVARLRQIPNVRIVLSCRLFDWNSDPRLKQVEIAQQFTLEKLSEDEVREVLAQIDVDFGSLSRATRELLKTPLQLDLFALALRDNFELAQNLQGITSLQELYGLLWQNIVLKQEPNAPSPSLRIEALNLLTEYMDREQITSAPLEILHTSDKSELEQAVNWLASAGILIRGKAGWAFLHQTFFDYCYARRFVTQGDDIVNTILASEQGILERRKLLQIISYLRGSNPSRYLQGLEHLLNIPELRYHLHDLLFRWFGALPDPDDDEWILAQRMLLDPDKRLRFLETTYGNPGWFSYLRDSHLPHWLSSREDVDLLAIPYLASMSEVSQADVIDLVKPYWRRNADWDRRIVSLLSNIRDWHTDEAIDLFEQCIYAGLISLDRLSLYDLGIAAQANPQTGCRLIRFLLDRILDQYLQKRKQYRESSEKIQFGPTLYTELYLLDEHYVGEALRGVSRAEPKLFVETIMPWLQQALSCQNTSSDEQTDCYKMDELSSGWHEDIFRTQNALVHSLIAALIELSKIEANLFRQVAMDLAGWPYRTSQQLLALVYSAVCEDYSSDACMFLLADQRRLCLGDNQQYYSRQLIRAVYPHLNSEQRSELERHILAYTPISIPDIYGLQRRGIEQKFLLQSIPERFLSSTGAKRLREWEHKFPDVRASEKPLKIETGFIGSPISEDIARKMSDANWLTAMRKYQGTTEHRDPFNGGALELSRVFASFAKDDPNRAYRIICKAPDDIDDAYVRAVMDGLAESEAQSELLFEVIRRFASQDQRNIRQAIAWALERRLEDSIPKDIVDLLDSYMHGPPGEDEMWWSTGENRDNTYMSYRNSERGSIFRVLMRIFDRRNDDEALQYKWSLIELAAQDSSTALRLVAIDELLYMIHHDHERAILLFEKLMDGHEVLLESQHVREFLYWAFKKHFLRLQPYIVSMIEHGLDHVQEQGAQLACIAALSPGAMESIEAQQSAQDLADQVIIGRVPWRRGAARIYSRNITGDSIDICEQKIISMLGDEDEQVRDHIDDTFLLLHDEHFLRLRGFVECYANSVRRLAHQFAEYLWKYGLLDSAWTLSIVDSILSNVVHQQGQEWRTSGIERLIRLVLRVYSEPMANRNLKGRAMDVFDVLMASYSGYTRRILSEWDQH